MKDLWAADRLEEMKLRLVRVGASDAEIEDFAEQWVNDTEWDHGEKQRLFALGDPKLRTELEQTRLDNLVDSTPDAELEELKVLADDDEAEAERIAALDAEAARVAAGSVQKVLEWVGDDYEDDAVLERAQASLDHEARSAKPRTTLVVALRELIEVGTEDDPVATAEEV